MYLITAPVVEPVSIAEVEEALSIDACSVDTDFSALIERARDYCEIYQHVAYMRQTWGMTLQYWQTPIQIPKGNLQSVAITYLDENSVVHTLVSGTDYYVGLKTGKVIFKSFPSDVLYPIDPITVTFVCGVDLPSSVPPRTRQAILFLVAHWFENRTPLDETRTAPQEISHTLSALLGMNKVVLI